MKSSLVDALFGNETERIPVWFMRQAGRYLPAYSALKKSLSIKEIAADTGLSAEVSYAPVRELGVDAAIIFSDIMLPSVSMGFQVDFVESVGPMVTNPIEDRMPRWATGYIPSADHMSAGKSISEFKKRYPRVPVIGFSGGPMTICSYLFAGKSDKDLSVCRRKLSSNPALVKEALNLVTEAVLKNVADQIRQGADAIQIFDSWATSLSHDPFVDYFSNFAGVIPSELGSSKVPFIYFTLNSAHHLKEFRESDYNCLSVDWKQNLREVADTLGPSKSVQGNLDPEIAREGGENAIFTTGRILDSMKGRPGFVFNLGHGVQPETNPATLKSIVSMVHRYGH
ncbi:MAG: uroporphyrinogen decarboxylase [Candidatus Thermoplasmatota archaeon]|nr:uroporphyrinogen decarboxylase [Candidatus Thermoplasmatota archaeon]